MNTNNKLCFGWVVLDVDPRIEKKNYCQSSIFLHVNTCQQAKCLYPEKYATGIYKLSHFCVIVYLQFKQNGCLNKLESS